METESRLYNAWCRAWLFVSIGWRFVYKWLLWPVFLVFLYISKPIIFTLSFLKFIVWDLFDDGNTSAVGKITFWLCLIGFVTLMFFAIREGMKTQKIQEREREAKAREEQRVLMEEKREKAWLLADITNRLERIERRLDAERAR